MHDVLGSAGMLRAWISVWQTQALWLIASMTIGVSIAAVLELVSARWRRRH